MIKLALKDLNFRNVLNSQRSSDRSTKKNRFNSNFLTPMTNQANRIPLLLFPLIFVWNFMRTLNISKCLAGILRSISVYLYLHSYTDAYTQAYAYACAGSLIMHITPYRAHISTSKFKAPWGVRYLCG